MDLLLRIIETTIIAILLATSSTGSLISTEVMYNPPGTDTHREWIEVYNDGVEEINISAWKLYEDGVSHQLTAVETQPPPNNDAIIKPGEYVVIAESPPQFIIDYLGYGGTLVDTSWSSLSNTGEFLALENPYGELIENLSYNATWGGNGNNKTLEKKNLNGFNGQDNWGESITWGGTPGKENSINEAIPPTTSTTSTTTSTTTTMTSTTSTSTSTASTTTSTTNTTSTTSTTTTSTSVSSTTTSSSTSTSELGTTTTSTSELGTTTTTNQTTTTTSTSRTTSSSTTLTTTTSSTTTTPTTTTSTTSTSTTSSTSTTTSSTSTTSTTSTTTTSTTSTTTSTTSTTTSSTSTTSSTTTSTSTTTSSASTTSTTTITTSTTSSSTTTTTTTTSIPTTSSTTSTSKLGTTTVSPSYGTTTTTQTTITSTSSTSALLPTSSTSTSTTSSTTLPLDELNLVINEIMYNPGSGQGPDGGYEYIELYNYGSKSIDLKSWILSDDGPDVETLVGFNNSPTVVPPYGYAVITDEDSLVEVPAAAVHLSTGDSSICTSGLSNTGESIKLFDTFGREVDSLEYLPWGANGNGMSLEKKMPEEENEEYNWGESLIFGGTPGERNSIYGVTYSTTSSSSSRATTTTTMYEKCNDGTKFGECSKNKSKYCFDGVLVFRCSKCGCPKNYECVKDECVKKTNKSKTNENIGNQDDGEPAKENKKSVVSEESRELNSQKSSESKIEKTEYPLGEEPLDNAKPAKKNSTEEYFGLTGSAILSKASTPKAAGTIALSVLFGAYLLIKKRKNDFVEPKKEEQDCIIQNPIDFNP